MLVDEYSGMPKAIDMNSEKEARVGLEKKWKEAEARALALENENRELRTLMNFLLQAKLND